MGSVWHQLLLAPLVAPQSLAQALWGAAQVSRESCRPATTFTILSSKPVLRGRQAVVVLVGSTIFSYLDLTMDQINQRTWRLQYLNVTHSVRNHFRYPYRCKIPITKGNSRLVGTHMGPKHITGMSGTNFKPTAGEESKGRSVWQALLLCRC